MFIFENHVNIVSNGICLRSEKHWSLKQMVGSWGDFTVFHSILYSLLYSIKVLGLLLLFLLQRLKFKIYLNVSVKLAIEVVLILNYIFLLCALKIVYKATIKVEKWAYRLLSKNTLETKDILCLHSVLILKQGVYSTIWKETKD